MTLTLCGCGLPERSFVSGVCVVLLLCGEEGGVFGDLVFFIFFLFSLLFGEHFLGFVIFPLFCQFFQLNY